MTTPNVRGPSTCKIFLIQKLTAIEMLPYVDSLKTLRPELLNKELEQKAPKIEAIVDTGTILLHWRLQASWQPYYLLYEVKLTHVNSILLQGMKYT